MIPTAYVCSCSVLLLLFLRGNLHIPVEKELGGNETIAKGRDHISSSQKGVSGFLHAREIGHSLQ